MDIHICYLTFKRRIDIYVAHNEMGFFLQINDQTLKIQNLKAFSEKKTLPKEHTCNIIVSASGRTVLLKMQAIHIFRRKNKETDGRTDSPKYNA